MPAESVYMRAMARLGDDPVRTARSLGTTQAALSPVRDRLIKRSMCYAPRLREIAFTVPLFNEHMKRWIASEQDLRVRSRQTLAAHVRR